MTKNTQEVMASIYWDVSLTYHGRKQGNLSVERALHLIKSVTEDSKDRSRLKINSQILLDNLVKG